MWSGDRSRERAKVQVEKGQSCGRGGAEAEAEWRGVKAEVELRPSSG